jgi:hypothetical protein
MKDSLRRDMESKGIDVTLSEEILDAYNSGKYDDSGSVDAVGVPRIDGQEVIDLRDASMTPGNGGLCLYSCLAEDARKRLANLGIQAADSFGSPSGSGKSRIVSFSASELDRLGILLLGKTAYGILNGGSATSYADRKKNLALGSDVFAALEPAFERIAPLCHGRPKGITPAYINPDGSPGASFLELKMRARLLLLRSSGAPVEDLNSRLPLYQMTSASNDAILSSYYSLVAQGSFLGPLSSSLGIEPGRWIGGIQPLMAAFTHSAEGRPKRIFDRAYGLSDSTLALPGGHGQCFRVLASTLEGLRASGKRFAYLGNVDNLGFTPDPRELALLALSGKPAAFEFAARASVDVKGGILVRTGSGKSTIADIGLAIGFDRILELEREGNTILFNCATGLFDLDYLVPRLAELSASLPVRFSDQDKDAGRYSQAEQSTWEVAGLLPSFLAFVVEKRRRFLAAKLLVETLLTSGIGLETGNLSPAMAATSAGLRDGLGKLLDTVYGLELSKGRWLPAD